MTAHDKNAGTKVEVVIQVNDNPARIKLNSSNMMTDEILVQLSDGTDEEGSVDLFQSGGVDTFSITLPDDFINSVQITRHDISSDTDPWKLRRIEIRSSGQKWTVDCYCWFYEYGDLGFNPRTLNFDPPRSISNLC
ncbi:uncharacterized protein LOC142357295 [Convolutriloba macropyga]|uniref:uncharacterized protein LOC142357295 n=1 Tax=Convolutriloba macropyga TaxID=536237 RepID=UPI003F51DDFB